MTNQLEIIGIKGIPETRRDDDIGLQIISACEATEINIREGDILVVTQKIVSKSEGRVVPIEGVNPSPLALEISEGHRRDPRHTELILRESKRIVRMDRGTIISETRHGFNCANAGIDASNIPGIDTVALLPVDPDLSAQNIRDVMRQKLGIDIAVIISDTFGRPWRNGAVNVAIGVAGIDPMCSYVGVEDTFGNMMYTTVICIADELSAAAELVMGKVDMIPVALIKGYKYVPTESASNDMMIRDPDKDMFR
jgi:coenzyme F420-0:L-glutamate ligase/coenzyme F420-1:gamma-L-glutamate ligase